jgi:hypothetical protein
VFLSNSQWPMVVVETGADIKARLVRAERKADDSSFSHARRVP